ncbi:MAG: hypothetical protein Kow0042_14510 [Calditrichia bacterium]
MKRIYWSVSFVLAVTMNLLAQTDSLNIIWQPNPEPDMYCYRLFRAVNNLNTLQQIQTIMHPQSHTVDRDNITPGNLYIYTLVACDSAGNQSGYSDTVSVGIPSINWNLSFIPSGQPTTLQLSDLFYDPDHGISDLSIEITGTTNLSVSISGNDFIILPDPLNFIGTGQFTVKVTDPDTLYDLKTISLPVSLPTYQEESQPLPQSFHLSQNYPNPFNPSTRISYQLPRAESVELVVFNALGQKVKTLVSGEQAAGYYSVNWDGTNDHGQTMSSGIYYGVFKSESYRESIRMMFIK